MTDEQKVMFDAHAGKGHRGGREGRGVRQGGPQGKFQKGMKGQRGNGPRFGDVDQDFDSEIQE